MNPHYTEMMRMDGQDLDIIVERTIEAQDKHGLDRTFSEEALDDVNSQMMTWVVSRMLRYSNETGLMPQGMRVSLHVELTS